MVQFGRRNPVWVQGMNRVVCVEFLPRENGVGQHVVVRVSSVESCRVVGWMVIIGV